MSDPADEAFLNDMRNETPTRVLYHWVRERERVREPHDRDAG